MAWRISVLKVLILGLVLVQLALAQHATIHADHASHHERCAICLLAKDMAHGVLPEAIELTQKFLILPVTNSFSAIPSLHAALIFYTARGPPVFPV